MDKGEKGKGGAPGPRVVWKPGQQCSGARIDNMSNAS